MTSNRKIHIGSGNYNERIEGDYFWADFWVDFWADWKSNLANVPIVVIIILLITNFVSSAEPN